MAFAPVNLTMQEAADTVRAGLQAIAAGERQIDLGALQSFDSSAVAALLEWQRAAATRGVSLGIDQIPEGLASLARVYGVAHLIGH